MKKKQKILQKFLQKYDHNDQVNMAQVAGVSRKQKVDQKIISDLYFMSLIHTLQTILEKQDFSSDYASFLLPFDTGSEDERKKLVEKYKSVENIALI